MYFMKIALPILSFFLISGCQTASNTAGEQTPLPVVQTAVVRAAEIVDTVQIYGQVVFRDETMLSSQFDGRIGDCSLFVGDPVRKGQKILTIIPPGREALTPLFDRVTGDARQLLENEIRVIELFSPIEGVVIETWRRNGDVVQRGEKILHIGDPRVLQILADIPVKLLPKLLPHQQFTVSFSGVELPPRTLSIAAISPRVNSAKQTAILRLNLPNPHRRYYPGMLAKIAIPVQPHAQALVVPRRAVLEEEGVFSVFVLKGHTVEKRTVVPGIMQAERIEIVEGLAEGETVVTEKTYSLVDGMEVRQ